MREHFIKIRNILDKAKIYDSKIKLFIASAEALLLIANELRGIKEELCKLNKLRNNYKI